MGPKSDKLSHKRGEGERTRREEGVVEDGGKDQRDASTSHGTPKITGIQQKLEERCGINSPSELPEGTTNLGLQNDDESKLLGLSSPVLVICCGSHSKLIIY